MVSMGYRHVPAPFAMGVVVTVVCGVSGRLALVDVTVMRPVQMPVMDVVDVVAVRNRHVPAPFAVGVVVAGVLLVCGG